MRIEHLWLSLPIAFVIWFSFLRRVGMVDFWWHLKTGQVIFTSTSIPRVDLFSFTCAGKPFVLQNWLVEVLYYAMYRAGGLPLLISLNTALLVGALIPVYYLCYRAAGGVRTAAVTVFLAVSSLLSFSNVRSQVFSFLCFSMTYCVLSAYRLRYRDLLWILPPLMLLWVNVHGAFVLGLGLIALFLVCEAIRRLVLGSEAGTLSPSELGRLAAIFVLTALATLVNPEGYRLYSSLAAVALDPVSQSFVTEWQAPAIDQLGISVFYGPFFISVLVLLYTRQRPDLTELVLFGGFAIFALTAVRNAIWFVLICTPIVARRVPTLDATRVVRRLRRFQHVDALFRWSEGRLEASTNAPVRYGLNTLIAIVMVVIAVILSPWIRPRLGVQRLGTTLWDPKTPVGAIEFIKNNSLRGNIFNPEIYGDYLTWRLWPQQRPFVDSRVHLFQECPALVNDYNLIFYDSHWEERLARYGIRYVLLNKDGRENRTMIEGAHASPQWHVLYEDELSVLFEKMGT